MEEALGQEKGFFFDFCKETFLEKLQGGDIMDKELGLEEEFLLGLKEGKRRLAGGCLNGVCLGGFFMGFVDVIN